MSNIYVATSWRNPYQELVVRALQGDGHEVYDFKHPTGPQSEGFRWGEISEGMVWISGIDGRPEKVHVTDYHRMITHPLAQKGFEFDCDALQEADIIVCVLPCGASAHLELGYGIGAEKFTAVISATLIQPELMYRGVDYFTNDLLKLCGWCCAPELTPETIWDIVPV